MRICSMPIGCVRINGMNEYRFISFHSSFSLLFSRLLHSVSFLLIPVSLPIFVLILIFILIFIFSYGHFFRQTDLSISSCFLRSATSSSSNFPLSPDCESCVIVADWRASTSALRPRSLSNNWRVSYSWPGRSGKSVLPFCLSFEKIIYGWVFMHRCRLPFKLDFSPKRFVCSSWSFDLRYFSWFSKSSVSFNFRVSKLTWS